MEPRGFTHVGPFDTQAPNGWMFASGVLLLLSVVAGYIFLAAFSAFFGSMSCAVGMQTAMVMATAFGAGVGFLAATAVQAPLTKVILIVVLFCGATAAAFVGGQLIYAPHCGVLPFL